MDLLARTLSLSMLLGALAASAFATAPRQAAPQQLDTSAPTVVEISQAPRIGLWSAWLTSGIRVHAKTLPTAAEPNFAVVVTITGGELLEPPGARGLADAAAASWSLPKEPEAGRAEVIRRYLDSQVRFKAVARTDCLQLVLSGPEQDLGLALELARVLIEQPGHDVSAFGARIDALREIAIDARSNPDRIAIDALRPFSLPASMPAARPVGEADWTALTSPVARDWLAGALMQGSIEVGIAARTTAPDALALAADALGSMTTRPRIASATLAGFRDGHPPAAPDATHAHVIPCAPPCESSRAVLAFLGPHRGDLASRRALALCAFIIDGRAEAALDGPPSPLARSNESRVRTFPMVPDVRSARSMIAVVIAPRGGAGAQSLLGDIEAVDQIITDLATLGPLPGELDEAKERVADILGAQDLSADAWATKLGTLTYDGLTPAMLAGAIDSYQALTADDVRRTLAEWWQPIPGAPESIRARVMRLIIAPE